MNKRKISIVLGLAILTSPLTGEFLCQSFISEAGAKSTQSTSKKSSKSSKSDSNIKSISKAASKGSESRSQKSRSATGKSSSHNSISVVYTDSVTGEWIHKGQKNIIIHRDAEGVVRAMSPFGSHYSVGEPYAEALNSYGHILKDYGVKVYSLLAPSMGEYYMPEMITENKSQEDMVKKVAQEYFSEDVIPIYVFENLRKHKDEEIFNRTDHHWAPLGAFYAAEVIAKQLGLPFTPLNQYAVDSVRDYVGTMYKFSGDPAVKNSPETFVYYITPGDYTAEFIDYTVVNGKTTGESEMHEAPVFRKFKDGSGAAYSTFLSGDNHTVKITNHNGNTNRKILIVKDSYGNAVAPYLINSFDEVHVTDFRFYPHNLIDYVIDNGITDLVFLNCTGLGLSKNTAERFQTMLKGGRYKNAENK